MENENKTFIFDKELPRVVRLVIKFLLVFLDIFYWVLLILARIKSFPQSKKSRIYNISVCAIFKNETLSLKEWIEYHLLVGVDHFYLYNNFSTDNYEQVLEPYIKDGIIDLIEWQVVPPSQLQAYEHCFTNFRDETQWIAFIDLDEFICPINKTSLSEWLKDFEGFHALIIYWKIFGTNGLIEHDPKRLIIEQYTASWEKYYDLGKTIFNTNFYIYRFQNKDLHTFSAKITFWGINIPIPPVNEFKKFIRYHSNRIGYHRNSNNFTIQLNHYWSKSYIEFARKIERGRADTTADKHKDIRSLKAFLWFENKTKTTDNKIQRFLIQLKVRMGQVDKYDSIIDFSKPIKTNKG